MSNKYDLKEMQIQSVPLPLLLGSDEFNIRDKDGAGFKKEIIEELADDIEANGQFAPIIVKAITEGKDAGKFMVIAGYRRWKAFALIRDRHEESYQKALTKAKEEGKDQSKVEKPSTIMVKVALVPISATDEDLDFINANENLQRQDLTSYDLARKFFKWKAEKEEGGFNLSARNIQDRLHAVNGHNLAVGYINNLARAYKRCIPKVHELWRKGDLAVQKVIDLSAEEDTARQEIMLNAMLGMKEAQEQLSKLARKEHSGEGGGDEGGKGAPEKPRGAGRKKLEALRVHLNQSEMKKELGPEAVKWSRLVLDYALGDMNDEKAAHIFKLPEEEEEEEEGKNGKGKKKKGETRAEA